MSLEFRDSGVKLYNVVKCFFNEMILILLEVKKMVCNLRDADQSLPVCAGFHRTVMIVMQWEVALNIFRKCNLLI